MPEVYRDSQLWNSYRFAAEDFFAGALITVVIIGKCDICSILIRRQRESLQHSSSGQPDERFCILRAEATVVALGGLDKYGADSLEQIVASLMNYDDEFRDEVVRSQPLNFSRLCEFYLEYRVRSRGWCLRSRAD